MLMTALLAVGTGKLYAQTPDVESAADIDMVVMLLLLAVIFVIPTIVAFFRAHPNRWPIFLINMFLGGTGIGWFGSLIWAFSAIHRSPTGNHGGESGLNIFANDPQIVHIKDAPWLGEGVENLETRLLRLKKLQDDGVITSDEFTRLRAPLLEKLAGTLKT